MDDLVTNHNMTNDKEKIDGSISSANVASYNTDPVQEEYIIDPVAEKKLLRKLDLREFGASTRYLGDDVGDRVVVLTMSMSW